MTNRSTDVRVINLRSEDLEGGKCFRKLNMNKNSSLIKKLIKTVCSTTVLQLTSRGYD